MHFFVLFFLGIIFLPAFGETQDSILITKFSGGDEIIFDGKWSSSLEWKPTSLNEIKTENDHVVIRTAHQENFVYVMLDVISDTTPSKNDKAIVCFDTLNDKSSEFQIDDYCFEAMMNSRNGKIYNGQEDTLKQITQKKSEFIGVGGISDENDRYSKVPHSVYEFKIPTDIIGRNNNYGFALQVNDDGTLVSWPANIDAEISSTSPLEWGNLVSPDKSLPEFDLTIVTLIIMISLGLLLSKLKQVKNTKLFYLNH